jgi:light-regulated signal transduction histidine kinase (bacteriophytochrome)
MTPESHIEQSERVAELEEELARTNAELKSMREELASFTYSVSHDLRAPIRTILGFSEALAEDYAESLDAQARDYVTRIQDGAHRMQQLIEGLIELSLVSRSDLAISLVDISAIARSISTRKKQRLGERDVQVVIQPDLSAYADSDLMSVCFNHLLDNAFKFTRTVPAPKIEVGSANEAGKTVFYVRDNGAGFDQTFSGKMFGAFQRLHSADEFEGLGMGLAIVQRIIHRHGGRAWAAGTVGEGATIYLALP